ncbi:MAG: hypothetical protein KC621_02095 [Myxococcales bacterium]|nr:hypothetical protein [Myxococcales bacterium]
MAKPIEGEDPYDFIDRLLEEQQMKHFELAGLVGEYRQHFDDMRENPTAEAATFARGLPGAKYRVNSKFVSENWLVLEAELQRLFPRPE